MTGYTTVHYYEHDCEWLTKYCDEYHRKTAVVPTTALAVPGTEWWEYNIAKDGEVEDEASGWFGDTSPLSSSPEFSPELEPNEKVVRRIPAGAWEPVATPSDAGGES